MTSIMLDFKETPPAHCNGTGVQSQGRSRRKGRWVLATVIALGVIAPLIPVSSYAQPACGLAVQRVCPMPAYVPSSHRPANNTIISQSQTNITINNIYLNNVGNTYGYSNQAGYVPAHYNQSTFPNYNGGVGRYPIY